MWTGTPKPYLIIFIYLFFIVEQSKSTYFQGNKKKPVHKNV